MDKPRFLSERKLGRWRPSRITETTDEFPQQTYSYHRGGPLLPPLVVALYDDEALFGGGLQEEPSTSESLPAAAALFGPA